MEIAHRSEFSYGGLFICKVKKKLRFVVARGGVACLHSRVSRHAHSRVSQSRGSGTLGRAGSVGSMGPGESQAGWGRGGGTNRPYYGNMSSVAVAVVYDRSMAITGPS